MNRRNLIIAAAVIVLLAAGVGAWLYNAVLGDTEAASGPITAVPLAVIAPTEAPVAAAPTEAPAAAAPTEAPAAAAPATTELTKFQIVQAESQASFTLDELLRGQPKTVVGTTDQVAGEIAVNPADLSSAQIGPITVNARTLATDSGMRDRAIKNFILSTDSYELITFAPTGITGLSGSGAPGTPYSFQIAGELTIRDTTVPVVFEATVTAESASRLSGTATTTVNRGDFGLEIPNVPSVANVSEQVQIEISFVAEAA
ncbi:YceI family protein [Oscillochloris sp. ZM17-4]|uniref:YceI family protein n=1 Tax=Oscillochloris sp. ZM17-4 TaxID=2866714 RepID=UPI001C73D471|nr:YceI family protein [Oscillochloris sp. ZM17-4]MBX0329975.1 YceI family protein [Oscillochloris sp. ZM17-4]